MHDWNVTPQQARDIQELLRHQVIEDNHFAPIGTVAGVDVGFEDQGKTTRAAVAVLAYPDLILRHYAVVRQATTFPYVPGLLSFREVPAVMSALEQLEIQPDLILCDGQGRAHPRRFGIACHLGVLTGIPTIGVAKSRLIGEHPPLSAKKGHYVPLTHDDETIGYVLRSRDNVKPLYISNGHLLNLDTALNFVQSCLTRYRLPETTRWAHRLASTKDPEQLQRWLETAQDQH